MPRAKKLSVCIATHNEEQNIGRCLDSVIDWADEVVIVDGSSTDRTAEIGRSYGKKVRVYRVGNPPMFHLNKQKAIEKAEGEWVLQLDADEEVSPKLKTEIIHIIENPSATAYWIPRLNYFLGKPLRKGGQYPDYTIRFYRNGAAKFPCRSVHEQVEIEGETARLGEDLYHYPYPDFSEYLNKWDRYCDLEAALLAQEGKRPGGWLFLDYFVIRPKLWFLSTYFRHKGFRDGFAGFVFSLFSAIRFWAIYIKLYEKQRPVKT